MLDHYEKLADLLLEAGINIQPGQNLLIRAEPIHWPFVNLLEKKAYKKGVRFIRTDAVHPASILQRLTSQKEEYLDYLPSYHDRFIQSIVEEHWSMIKIDSMEDPDIFNSVDPKRNVQYQKAQRESAKELIRAFSTGEKSWTIGSLPTPKWAAKVLGGSPNEDGMKAFWDILIPFLRLDKKDPVVAWKRQGKILQHRCDILDKLALSSLHFKGPGTDLKIFLTPLSRWVGGPVMSQKNGLFFPNLPTEEVFTTPDYRKTEGFAVITKPIKIMNKTVTNARFNFKEGRIIDYDADLGKDALDAFFKMDDQAGFLGEVALVDESSPICRSDKLFDSIVLDENAASHMALGFGYPGAMEGGLGMTPDELSGNGCNQSLVHLDFMIGSPGINVTGLTRDQNEIAIIENGYFVI